MNYKVSLPRMKYLKSLTKFMIQIRRVLAKSRKVQKQNDKNNDSRNERTEKNLPIQHQIAL